DALAGGSSLLNACQQAGASRLAVQMPGGGAPVAVWDAYGRFLRKAHAAGIETFALDGAPGYARAPAPLWDALERLRDAVPKGGLDGLELDIEAYLDDGFGDDPADWGRYLAVLERAHELVANHNARLSVVIPFWFTSTTYRGRALAFWVADRADSVTVMSYRTDAESIQSIGEDTLRYGQLRGVPVWLSIETRALADERHLLLRPTDRRDQADAYVDRGRKKLVLARPTAAPAAGSWFHVTSRFPLRADRLSVARQPRAQVLSLIDAVAQRV